MSRRMSFRTVAFRRRKSLIKRQSIEHPPYLVIRSTDFLRSPPPPLPVPSQSSSDGLGSVVLEQKPASHPNVAVECFVNDDRIRTCVFVKFYDLDLVRFDKASLPACVRVASGIEGGSSDGSIVTFVIDKDGDSLDQVVPTFLSSVLSLSIEYTGLTERAALTRCSPRRSSRLVIDVTRALPGSDVSVLLAHCITSCCHYQTLHFIDRSVHLMQTD